MAAQTAAMLDLIEHRIKSDDIPAHHVIVNTAPSWMPYLTTWNYTQSTSPTKKISSRGSLLDRSSKHSTDSQPQNKNNVVRKGFQNPWPSWHKPTRKQIWDALEWGEDQDPCIQLAASHAPTPEKSVTITSNTSSLDKVKPDTRSRAQLASAVLKVQTPDFEFDPSSQQSKTTWLGHAGVLVQLPPLGNGGRPIRCIFDPIFSTRSSPSQTAGPIRSYPAPCKIEQLPPVDVYMLSHNHHDHLDYDTVMSLWKINKAWIRFLVPLGNKPWFIDCGIDADRVVELDWWESVELRSSNSEPLKITCTPNQHNSGRTGMDANETLWSSWYLEHPQSETYKVYFAGDTGYQFHPSAGWPPEPPLKDGNIDIRKQEYEEKDPYPSCPAFEEIAERLGTPDLLLLPIAVGATFSFLRSYIPLPDSLSPFPRHKPGLTGANHMPPWDAVHVFRLMTAKPTKSGRTPLALAIHWGTFVPERTEVLKTLGQLEWACIQQNVQFGRSLDDVKDSTHAAFLALNHGQSVIVANRGNEETATI